MPVRLVRRDLFWIAAILSLIFAGSLWQRRSAVRHDQELAAKQRETAAVVQSNSELKASVEQLQEQVNEFENRAGAVRRFLLMHIRPAK